MEYFSKFSVEKNKWTFIGLSCPEGCRFEFRPPSIILIIKKKILGIKKGILFIFLKILILRKT